MFSLLLLAGGTFLILSRRSTKRSSSVQKSLPINGIKFDNKKIELTDKSAAIDTIVKYMDNFIKMNNLANYDSINFFELAKYIFKSLNLSFYCKFYKKQKVTMQEKMIAGLLVSFIFDTMNIMVEDSEFFQQNYENTSLINLQKFLQMSDDDLQDLEKIDKQFEMTFAYP